MALTSKPLNQIITAARGTAATFTGSDGVQRGVAFSITPNTIGTGSRTFNLQGGTGQNLGFVVGQSVRAMDAGAGTSDMQGTVTSYSATTQVLVMNVLTTTGSGSFSNWRIGTLEPVFTFDDTTLPPEGIQTEQAFTNLLQYSRQLENAYWVRAAGGTGVVPTLQPNAALAPDGSFSAARVVFNKGAGTTLTDDSALTPPNYTQILGLAYTSSVWIRSATSSSYTLKLETATGVAAQTKAGSTTGLITVTPTWQRFEAANFSATTAGAFRLRLRGTTGTSDFADVYIWQPQVTQSFFCNTDIPSATAFTSRASGGTRFNRSGVLSGFDTSTTSNTVGTGPRTFTLGATANEDRGYIVGETLVRAEQTGTPANFVQGLVTAYNPATQSLTIEVTTTGGTGTIASWSLTDGGARFTYNPANLAHGPNLQLEPAATNLLLNSATLSTQNVTTVANTYTLSFYGTGTVTLSGTATGSLVGAGVFPARNFLVFTATAGTLTVTVTGSVQFAQIEVGSGPTSYIPTAGAQVTRAADVATSIATVRNADTLQITGSNFSQFYSPTQGTWVASFKPDANVSGTALSVNDGTGNNAMRVAQRAYPLMTFSKGVTNGTVDLIGTNAAGAALLRNDGVSMTSRFSGEAAVINQVAYDGVSKFLSTGAAETIIETASDGVANTVRSINTTHGGAFFGGPASLFVVAGNTGRISISPDGLAWERIQTPETVNQLSEVTASATTYVVVGLAGVIYTSTDARVWVSRNSGATSEIRGVTWSGSLFAACRTGGTQNVITSPDGITWTPQTTVSAQNQNDIHFANGIFVCVGNAGTIQTSNNGTTWTAATSNTTQQLNGVTYDAASGLWVAVGVTGTVVYSTTPATTWTNGTANTGTTKTLNEVAFFGGLFVAIGSGQTIITNSAANIQAGGTWASRTANVSSTLTGIATNGTSVVVTGSNNGITTSPDGITWTSRTANNGTQRGAAYGANTWVIAGDAQGGSGVIATVSNSGVYQRRVSNTTQAIQAGLFAGGRFVFGAANSVIVTSTDGITWTAVTVAGTATTFNQVAYSGSLYVAIGTSGRYSTSTDGLTWATIQANGASTQTFSAIAFDQGLFISVGDSGAIITSANGTTWTLRTSGTTQSLRGVHYSTRDGVWYAYGVNTILRSPDAITWTDAQGDVIPVLVNGGAIQVNRAGSGKFNPTGLTKVAMSYDGSTVDISVNGGPVVSQNVSALPTVDRLTIGSNGLLSDFFNGNLQSIRYLTSKTTGAALQALSI